jgi:glyoxylase-like metal-dependent hydrolase (beta-lactamase superfamily II)
MSKTTSRSDTSGLAYAFAEPAPFGEPIPVAPGVAWLRMPLPFSLDHINLWLVEDADGWCLIDSGFARDEVKAIWRRLFETDFSTRPAERLICTHFHPDHIGLAGWLEADYGVNLWATEPTWMAARLAWLDHGAERRNARHAFYAGHGVTGQTLEDLRTLFESYSTDVTRPPMRFRQIDDGELLRIGQHDWRVIVGHGHAPGHACLHCPALGVLISGDQVLPRITTNIGVWDSQPDADPLADFLASLARLRTLPEDTLVLPSHGLPFRGLHARIDALVSHHADRFAEAIDFYDRSRSAVELVPVMFRRELDSFQTALALGEVLAHLNHLTGAGRLSRTVATGGVTRFGPPSSP